MVNTKFSRSYAWSGHVHSHRYSLTDVRNAYKFVIDIFLSTLYRQRLLSACERGLSMTYMNFKLVPLSNASVE